jgi:hypothetical protein
MDTLRALEKAVFDKQPLPEFTDFTLWREITNPLIYDSDDHLPSPTQCALALWFCEEQQTAAEILEFIEKFYPDYYSSVLPNALAKAIVEEWPLVAYNLILKMSQRKIPFYDIILSLITKPRDVFVGMFDPRAKILPPRR